MKKQILLLIIILFSLQVNAHQQKKQHRKSAQKSAIAKVPLKSKQKGDDSFVWYKINKNGLYGAADIDGNIIIPPKYTRIGYHCYDFDAFRYFYVYKNDYKGIYTRSGKCIISTDKHFTQITGYECKKGDNDEIVYQMFEVENNNGEKGIYDLNGNEVIAPDYFEVFIPSCPAGKDLFPTIYAKKQGEHIVYDLNGNKITSSSVSEIVHIYRDKINIYTPVKGKSGKEKYIYGSFGIDSKYNYFSYDGLFNPRVRQTWEKWSAERNSNSTSIAEDKYNSNSSANQNDGASSSRSSSSYRGNGSSAAVAPLMTPVQVWNPCFMCGGTGLCTSCQGKGKDWYGNSYQLCVTCHGNMYCQKCGGRKGYYTTEYR